MSRVAEELVFLILQFLYDKDFKDAAHMLGCETGLHFDMKYFENMVFAGEFDNAESYLSWFTSIYDNDESTKIYFELRKQKFLEALDKNNRDKALNILMKDLKGFPPKYEEFFKEMAELLTTNNIRENKSLSTYKDAVSVRKLMIDEIKLYIQANPVFIGRLKLPEIKCSRLLHFVNKSFKCHHQLYEGGVKVHDIRTLLEDHVCKPCLDLLPLQSEGNTSSDDESDSNTSLSGDNSDNSSHVTDVRHFYTGVTNSGTELVNPKDPNVLGSFSESSNEVTSAIDLPAEIVQTLKEDSTPTSMDFHPIFHKLLLVGTDDGTIGLWDVDSGKKLFSRKFSIWNVRALCSSSKDQIALANDLNVSVRKVAWSSDGSLFGVAFSKHIAQLYSYDSGNGINQRLEIGAHDGSVNDIAFSYYKQQLLVITCGDDMKIKAWDAVNGAECFTFEGHKAPVCSIFPHMKENVQLIFSTSTDGKINAWLFDGTGSSIDVVSPCYGHSGLAYSADGQRLFSCGGGKDGEPYLMEWNDSEGSVKRIYKGLKKPYFSTAQFDTIDQILVVGDNYKVKFWDMDKVDLWARTDVNGDLLKYPCIRFNKVGTLLAVSTKENKIQILANNYSMSHKLGGVHTIKTWREAFGEQGSKVVRSNPTEESPNQPKIHCNNVYDICEPSQLRFMQIPLHSQINKIEKVAYNNVGKEILVLSSNGNQVLWKWPKSSLNLDGMATTQVRPQFFQPENGLQCMTNELLTSNSEDQVSYFAVSKNDSYLLSTSGGTVSLFNLLSYKALTIFYTPPPVVTCLAFYPRDNNIIAIGMANSSIDIYNVRTDSVLRRLKGHSKRVSAVAFSTKCNILVSADLNGHIIAWSTIMWQKLRERQLQMHGGVLSETDVQFNKDQTHFLAVHRTHLGIYEAPGLQCVSQLAPEFSVIITQAAYSSDGKIVYAIIADGNVAIFDALNMQMRVRIRPSAYLFPTPRVNFYPTAIAANPLKPTQFAVGLTDGRVYVIEPTRGGSRSFLLDHGKEKNNPMTDAGVSKLTSYIKFK